MRRYWTKIDIAELTRLSNKAKSKGKVLDVVKCAAHRSPLAVFHKLTSLGLMYDASKTVKVWSTYV